MPRVSIVIVTHNNAGTIAACLGSLPADAEVFVIDNLSVDGTAEIAERERPDAIILHNTVNIGFGAANNQGLSAAIGDYALLLNPDAYATGGAVETLADFLDANPPAVACGGLLRFDDGRVQPSAARELTLTAVFFEQTFLEKLFHVYWHSGDKGPARQVAQVMGACIMLRRADGVFPQFDERFFLYCEDTELCKRLGKAGEIWQVRDALFVHELGTSSKSSRWQAVSYYNRGKELYFEIHRGTAAAFWCWVFDRKGAFIRMLGWTLAVPFTGFRAFAFEKVALFWRVLTAPRDPYPKGRTL